MKDLTGRQRALISALLQHASIAEAAKQAEVPLSTAHRWMQTPAFAAAVRASRRTLTDRATAMLQASMLQCAAKLRKMALDETLPASIQLTAARTVLEFGYKGSETDVQAQIDEIKEILNSSVEAGSPTKKRLRVV